MNSKIYSPCSNGSLKIASLISTFIFRPVLRRLLDVEVRLNVGVVSSKTVETDQVKYVQNIFFLVK